jgi:hypothetical protein
MVRSRIGFFTLVAALAGCSSGGSSASPTPESSQAAVAILSATSTIAIPSAGGTFTLPTAGQAQGTTTFPAGTAESVTVQTDNGPAQAPPSYPSGRCTIVQTENFTFPTAGSYASIPALTIQFPATQTGTYTLEVFDIAGGALLESQDANVGALGAATTSIAFSADPVTWTISAGHTYAFEIIGPSTASCSGTTG